MTSALPSLLMGLGMAGLMWPKDIVDVQGRIAILDNRSAIRSLRESGKNLYWSGPDDPSIGVLKLVPDVIALSEGYATGCAPFPSHRPRQW